MQVVYRNFSAPPNESQLNHPAPKKPISVRFYPNIFFFYKNKHLKWTHTIQHQLLHRHAVPTFAFAVAYSFRTHILAICHNINTRIAFRFSITITHTKKNTKLFCVLLGMWYCHKNLNASCILCVSDMRSEFGGICNVCLKLPTSLRLTASVTPML